MCKCYDSYSFQHCKKVPTCQYRDFPPPVTAHPYFTGNVKMFLSGTFHEYWIGQRGPMNWLARSPDLTAVNLYGSNFDLLTLLSD